MGTVFKRDIVFKRDVARALSDATLKVAIDRTTVTAERKRAAALADFPEFDAKLKKLIHTKKTSLMQEFRFWPTSPPRQLGGVFELRTYTLHPGNLLEWETHWQKGLAARREVMEGVGGMRPDIAS